LGKAFNKTPEELSELLYTKSEDSDELVLKEDALDLLVDMDVQKVQNIKGSVKPDKDTLQQINDAALKKSREDFEKKIKAQYGLEDSTAQGLQLVQQAVESASSCDISDDTVKQHSAFLEMEKAKNDEIERLKQEHEEYMLNQDRRTRLDRVKKDVLEIFAGLNPIESQNTTVAQNRRNDMLRRFDNFEYEIDEQGNHFVKNGDKRLEDGHGNPIKFKDHVVEIVRSCYDLAQSSGGNAGNHGGGKQSGGITVPKDEKEYLTKWAELKTQGKTEEAIALTAAWNAAH